MFLDVRGMICTSSLVIDILKYIIGRYTKTQEVENPTATYAVAPTGNFVSTFRKFMKKILTFVQNQPQSYFELSMTRNYPMINQEKR